MAQEQVKGGRPSAAGLGEMTQKIGRLRQWQEEKKKKRKKALLLLLLLLLLCAGALVWFFLFGPGASGPPRDKPLELERQMIGGDVQDGVFTKGMTAEEIEAALQAVADKDNFNLQISPEMVFENGSSVGTIEIVNPQKNVYPISAVITLEDGRVAYESGLIKPGQYVAAGKLLVNLPAGAYKATAEVSIHSADDGKVRGATGVEMNIRVKN